VALAQADFSTAAENAPPSVEMTVFGCGEKKERKKTTAATVVIGLG
jgi:hypothetical protein